MTEDRQLRAAIYARVSTNDQGQDPETQLHRLRQVCRTREYKIMGGTRSSPAGPTRIGRSSSSCLTTPGGESSTRSGKT